MSVLFVALPLAILLGAAGLIACLHCIRSGQYEDLDSESFRILVEQRPEKPLQGTPGASDLGESVVDLHDDPQG